MRGFRSAFTILFALIVIVAGSASVIPAGQYGRVLTEALGIDTAVPGTYQIVASDPPGSLDALRTPIAGFYDPASDAANAIDGSLFVLTIGGFLRVVNRTGAMLFLGAALMIGGAKIGMDVRTLLRRSRRTDLAMKNAERRGDMGSTGTRIRGALGPFRSPVAARTSCIFSRSLCGFSAGIRLTSDPSGHLNATGPSPPIGETAAASHDMGQFDAVSGAIGPWACPLGFSIAGILS